jgi:hypothetical protein
MFTKMLPLTPDNNWKKGANVNTKIGSMPKGQYGTDRFRIAQRAGEDS